MVPANIQWCFRRCQRLGRTDPGYMHVRIQSDMLISSSSEPKDDIVERNNRFYVYLKPQGSDNAAIKRRSNFPAFRRLHSDAAH